MIKLISYNKNNKKVRVNKKLLKKEKILIRNNLVKASKKLANNKNNK